MYTEDCVHISKIKIMYVSGLCPVQVLYADGTVSTYTTAYGHLPVADQCNASKAEEGVPQLQGVADADTETEPCKKSESDEQFLSYINLFFHILRCFIGKMSKKKKPWYANYRSWIWLDPINFSS